MRELKIFLIHPGGPFWKNKDAGAWSIPKGEFGENEQAFEAARREFFEETGFEINGKYILLDAVKLKSGKIIYAFAIEGDCDASSVKSNLFEIEWPPKSGKFQQFPEVDKAGWFAIDEVRKKIHSGQINLIEQLIIKLHTHTK